MNLKSCANIQISSWNKFSTKSLKYEHILITFDKYKFYKDFINCARFHLNRSIWSVKQSDFYSYLIKYFHPKNLLVSKVIIRIISNKFNTIIRKRLISIIIFLVTFIVSSFQIKLKNTIIYLHIWFP